MLYWFVSFFWFTSFFFFFFQAADGIRDWSVTGVQTCALPILVCMGIQYRYCPSSAQGTRAVFRREHSPRNRTQLRRAAVILAVFRFPKTPQPSRRT